MGRRNVQWGSSTWQSQANADAAVVGFSNGTTNPGTNYDLPGSQTDGAFVDSNASTGLIHGSANSNADGQGAGVLGRYIFQIRNGVPVTSTSVSTALSGGGQYGRDISVPPGTPVIDAATVRGETTNAGGIVYYNVYSDPSCRNLVQSAGGSVLSGGAVGASSPVTLYSPGAYYWQAYYAGDSSNSPSADPCGSEIEYVSTATRLAATPAILQVSGLQLYLYGLNATLTTASGPVGGQTVNFSAGGTSLCSAVTAANGTASCSALLNLPGVLASVLADGYTASFGGTPGLGSSSTTAPLIG